MTLLGAPPLTLVTSTAPHPTPGASSSGAAAPLTGARRRQPRDSQRVRVYRAESHVPSSPLPGLDACANYADRVVGSLWWAVRFPAKDLGARPRLRPGNGARHAFYREEPSGPSITLPRRFRTKGTVLHELAHWSLGLDSGLPHHGRTFARVLHDLIDEFCGAERAAELATGFRTHGVHVGAAPRPTPEGHLLYGWDERIRLGRGAVLALHHLGPEGPTVTVGRLTGLARRGRVAELVVAPDTVVQVPLDAVHEVVEVEPAAIA